MKTFGRFQLDDNGDVISDIGYTYSLLEGVSYPIQGYTSDIVFILDYNKKPSGMLVGWLYGANNPGIEDDICDIIDEYERTGKRLI